MRRPIPAVKIDFQSIPYNDFFQKIGPSLEAGTGPDVFQIPGPLVREFYDRDQLSPVPDSIYLAADIDKDFLPWTVSLLKAGRQLRGFADRCAALRRVLQRRHV